MSGKHSAGKGDKYRPVDKKQYDKNYNNIFGKKISKTKGNKKLIEQLDIIFGKENN